MGIKVKVTEMSKENDKSLVGLVDINFGDAIKARNVAVRMGENGMYVTTPGYATNTVDENGKTVYRNFVNPMNPEARKKLFDAIFESLDTGKEVTIDTAENKVSASAFINKNPNISDEGKACIYFNDEYAFNDIRISEAKDGKEAFLKFPSYKSKQLDENGNAVYKNYVYPADNDVRADITKIVLKAFDETKNKLKVMNLVKETSNEILADEKPKGVKEKLTDGNKKSKSASQKKAATPKKAKENAIE